jgi:hypothetical protein
MKKEILICDDNPRDAEMWSESIKAHCLGDFEVKIAKQAAFFDAVTQLEARRGLARRRGGGAIKWGDCAFDEADIIVVDYDLLKLDTRGYLTGEDVAYLCRCYSRCGLIVGLNQYGTNYFDLTLRGHPESYCDLNIGSDQLECPGLWSETWTGKRLEFRPWYWPLLPEAHAAFLRRTRQVLANLDAIILAYLDFDEQTMATLPRSTREFLFPGKSPEKTTFASFVSGSGNGLRPKDRQADQEAVARIASARIWKWLERLVLAGQDILVDAPHLASRYPSLLRGNPLKLGSWDGTTSLLRGHVGLKPDAVREFRFKKSDWLSRPVWFWKRLSASEKIREVLDPLSKEEPGFVFCEDVSRFLRRDVALEFVADVPSPFVRRFVVDPRSRAAKAFKGRAAQYEPAVRFAF